MANTFIDDGVESGEFVLHGGKKTNMIDQKARIATMTKRRTVTQVVFLLNIKKLGEGGCFAAKRLIVVDILGDLSIGKAAFIGCGSLTTVCFPTTLASIGENTF